MGMRGSDGGRGRNAKGEESGEKVREGIMKRVERVRESRMKDGSVCERG